MKIEIRVLEGMPKNQIVVTPNPVPADASGEIDGTQCVVLNIEPRDVTGPQANPFQRFEIRLCSLLMEKLEHERDKHERYSKEWEWWDEIILKVDKARREWSNG